MIGVAWQGQAADVLQRDAGIPSQTAALLLDRIARGEEDAIPAGAVIVCDEASMMPTRALGAARQRGGLALRRASSWSATAPSFRRSTPAGGFAALADRLGAAELTENRRQRTDLQRQVAERLAEGRAGDALALLAEHGRLQAFDDAREARAALVAAWAEASLARSRERGLILAHDRHEVADAQPDGAGALDECGLCSDRRGSSSRDASGRSGDRLRLPAQRLLASASATAPAGRWSSSTAASERLARAHRRRARWCACPADYLGDVQHGYALTGHISQGATVDRTFLLATPERGGREWAYVAASRQRVDLTLFAVHHEPEQMESALARSWGRSDAKRLALDHVEGPSRSTAVDAARSALDAELPERRAARLRDLSERRERARARVED